MNNKNNQAAWIFWSLTKAKYSNRLNKEYFIKLDNEIKESHAYIVPVITPMPSRVIIGEACDGNYVRATFNGIC